MSLRTRLFGSSVSRAEAVDLDEWVRHHDDPRSEQGFQLYMRATNPDLTLDELRAMWETANSLVGQRAPADYGEFLAYGYIQGRKDALINAVGASKSEHHAGTPRPHSRDPKSTGLGAPSSALAAER